MLRRVLSNLFRSTPAVAESGMVVRLPGAKSAVLDVGGGSHEIPLPLHYTGWTRCLIDIDPAAKPDIVLDARELGRLQPAQFDAVYCSHNLEHYYAHEVKALLLGFVHALKPGGFAEIRVPDVAAVAREISLPGRDLDDVLYDSPAGPITARDILYGLERWIEKSGQGYFAHKRATGHSAPAGTDTPRSPAARIFREPAGCARRKHSRQ
jgi:SAM-dependent methyltransferase